ncbi:Cephalotocin receptor 2 [Toxocara canis]|uniref:Cephalotocin receptor 2 n=1 Tax=Toxocara canis TaxID=6265 RepID=A0A0B2VM00_TOXCA|nr:Cephalotocin receptor 2 [Toxocara canis]
MAASFYYCVCKAVWASNFSHSFDTQISPATKLDVFNSKSFQTQFYLERIRRGSGHMKRQTTELDRKRVQTVRLTMTIIVCNFFLWAPFCVVNVVQALAPRLLSAELITYIVILGNLNSCVNPWIYILFNRNHAKRALCMSSTVAGTYSHNSEYTKERKLTVSPRRFRNSDILKTSIGTSSDALNKSTNHQARRIESMRPVAKRSISLRSPRPIRRVLSTDGNTSLHQNKEHSQRIAVNHLIVNNTRIEMRSKSNNSPANTRIDL